MNWLTQKYIKKQAVISDEAALEVSIGHHQQIHDATEEELREEYARTVGGVIDAPYCALCKRFSCCNCILGRKHCIDGEWQIMHDEARRWLNGKSPHAAFLAAHKPLLDKLKSLRKGKTMICGILSDVYKNGKRVEKGVFVLWDGIAVAPTGFEGKQLIRWIADTGWIGFGPKEDGYSYRPVPCEVVDGNRVRTDASPCQIIYRDDAIFISRQPEQDDDTVFRWRRGYGYSYRRIEKPETTEVLGVKYEATEAEVKKQLEGLKKAK